MDSKALELADTLERKTAQLESALLVAGNDSFDDFSQEIKGNFLWLCSDLSTEIRDDFDKFRTAMKKSSSTEGGDK